MIYLPIPQATYELPVDIGNLVLNATPFNILECADDLYYVSGAYWYRFRERDIKELSNKSFDALCWFLESLPEAYKGREASKYALLLRNA